MKILNYLCALALLCGAANSYAQKIDPITRAVLEGYGELLKENPKDYESLYERGGQYYQLGMFEEARKDLTSALQYTPKKDTELRQRENTLLSAIESSLGNYDAALAYVNEALTLKPGDYFNTYKKGDILLSLGRNDEAYRAFSSMQSMKSRSQEAYYGMARVAVARQDYPEADGLIKEIKDADPTNPNTFIRIGNLYRQMNQPENASANYIVAIAMGAPTATPLSALNDIASTNYKAVATALDFAIDKSEENKTIMLFLKGNIAMDSGNYYDAEDAFQKLLKYPDGQIAGVYNSLANVRFALGDMSGATEAVNQAINIEQKADYYMMKAQIELASENYHGAITDANEAARLAPDEAEAYVLAGEAYALSGNGNDAISQLNKAVMIQPDNLNALLTRAYTYEEVLKNSKMAQTDYNRIILEQPSAFPEIAIKGIAQAKAGKKADADAMLTQALSTSPSAEDLYWGAVYYAQTGDLERAKTLADQAEFQGFRNQTMLKKTSTPWLNLSPIRHLMK